MFSDLTDPMGLAWGGTGAFLLSGSHPLASAQVLAMRIVTSLPAWLPSGQSSTTRRQEVEIMLLEGSLGDPVGISPQSPSVCWSLVVASSLLLCSPSCSLSSLDIHARESWIQTLLSVT